jgi:hypothetical protein
MGSGQRMGWVASEVRLAHSRRTNALASSLWQVRMLLRAQVDWLALHLGLHWAQLAVQS